MNELNKWLNRIWKTNNIKQVQLWYHFHSMKSNTRHGRWCIKNMSFDTTMAWVPNTFHLQKKKGMISWYQRHTYLLVLDVATVATPLTLKCLLLKSRCSRREVCGAVHVSICLRKIHPLINCQGEGVPIFESKNVTFWKIKLKKFRVHDVVFYSSSFKMILFRSSCHVTMEKVPSLRPRFSTEAWERFGSLTYLNLRYRNSTEKEVDRFNPPKTGTEKWNCYTTTSTFKKRTVKFPGRAR